MSKRKDHIRKFIKSRQVLHARSNIGEIIVACNPYHEAHIVCYNDCSGVVTLRSNRKHDRPLPLTGRFCTNSSVLGYPDAAKFVEEMVATFTRGKIPLTDRAGCFFSPKEEIEFRPGEGVMV